MYLLTLAIMQNADKPKGIKATSVIFSSDYNAIFAEFKEISRSIKPG